MGPEAPSAGSSTTSRGRTRRPHQKSREGCTQCKDRHVKCNEVHPRCRNCQKMDIRCSFSAPASVPASMPLNPESLMDLELLQYCNRRPGPGHDSVDLGFTHHYLLNSILALAALQLHREAPSRHKWYARAVSHQQAALTRSKPHLQKLDASQRHALVSFSALTSVYSAAEPMARPGRIAHDKPEFNAVREMVHSIRLSRASTTFVQQHMAQDIASNDYLRYKYGQPLRTLPDGLDEKCPQLAPLRALIDKYCPVHKRAICLDAAARALAGIYQNQTEGGGERPGATWDWSNGVDDAFLEMCVEENPAALIILAHYAALISTENDAWFLRTWPSVLVKYISRRLGEGWKEMEWPMSVVLGTSELGLEGSASISVSTSSPDRSPSHQSPGSDAEPEVEV
ncbi:hypothetical protein B0T11DRAFT_230630 [Plectosphaerella cucumerina]|uniref:Zn(2)-C6 fungal-type domain-containing protein n=1 Tax=Plectosphaerella cucumerina TaxID=40658 RepID=A0A8K0T5S8_9PEZI|nr:hypothetical protein B0T11DRAFT_230630 [Plectosphaerella cucumerina]